MFIRSTRQVASLRTLSSGIRRTCARWPLRLLALSSQALGIGAYMLHVLRLPGYILRSILYRTARVWRDFQQVYELRGHEQSVWAVQIVDEAEQTFLTGLCALALSVSHIYVALFAPSFCGQVYSVMETK